VGYLCSEPYAPAHEHGIHPTDPALGLPWPDMELRLSPKDEAAPTLAEALEQGLLPDYAECMGFIDLLRG
jgi:dTDP-4-dehydrorhamnose 3,5-epimerase